MNISILVINSIVGICAVLWAVFLLVPTLMSMFDSPNSTMWTSMPILLLYVSVPLLALLSIIFSNIDHSKRAIIWAIIPLLYLLAFVFYLGIGELKDHKEKKERQKANSALLKTISRDYVCKLPNALFKEKFLTLDKENNVLVSLALTASEKLMASPIGKVKGTHLEVLHDGGMNKESHGGCVDANGKTYFDTYTVVLKPDQNVDDYHLEKYETQ